MRPTISETDSFHMRQVTSAGASMVMGLGNLLILFLAPRIAELIVNSTCYWCDGPANDILVMRIFLQLSWGCRAEIGQSDCDPERHWLDWQHAASALCDVAQVDGRTSMDESGERVFGWSSRTDPATWLEVFARVKTHRRGQSVGSALCMVSTQMRYTSRGGSLFRVLAAACGSLII